jgi:Tfp pilus assembly protein PilF
VKIDPTFALAQNQLGYLMTRSGDPGAAEAHFRQAVKSAPAFTDGWINLAATLALEKHFLEAQEAVANALRLEPTNAQALQLSQDLNAAAQR